MTSALGEMETMLAAWRDAEAKAEALRQFRDTGGEHRLRVSTDANDQVPARLLAEMMEGDGFRWFITNAIKIAEHRAAVARNGFLATASAEAVASEIGGAA